ncbi:NAD(P)H-dependent glycerol-3-phosphate dehydrogenase [Methanobacterium formicicum]|jgi:glycerol-3-phosphate dehydrogenase (NAD(P)+)|uniref:Glycerol-3-phosphate dehydrogenase [NAD(P)+] n=1 Tax=Methanobacterium formicicum TaxID=2162 RepID=A0A0S4FQ27_METFO|nr:NAD(P)H-dependent glycerol-3-phosphate dehydrogenase [Methanobacterium formicicum]CEL25135.1 Glycerol-3-phosphate dehydrogenase [NAD(P)+] [Methanobacterium formicicum]
MKVSVLGPGSFGTAVAQLISQNVNEINLFGRNKDIINSINQKNINNVYHPWVPLNENIKAFKLENKNLIMDSDLIIFCIPSGSTRIVAEYLSGVLDDQIVISTAKGIEYPSVKYMTQVIKEETGLDNIFSLSGPTFADELIRNVLSAVTMGIRGSHKDIINLFKSPNILLDVSEDVEGVELCSILKNIYATAMGIFDTYYQGNNEHNALLNLCFKEMDSILRASGHMGLYSNFCSFGDLVLTANTDKSRNRTIGLMLGKNMKLDPSSPVNVESIKSVKAIKMMSNNYNFKTPILDFVDLAFDEREDIRQLMNQLIKRLDYSPINL